MEHQVGRNDPCPCGSGKKFKQCCFLKAEEKKLKKGKLTAKWLNKPEAPNLMDRAFGQAIANAEKAFKPLKKDEESSGNST